MTGLRISKGAALLVGLGRFNLFLPCCYMTE